MIQIVDHAGHLGAANGSRLNAVSQGILFCTSGILAVMEKQHSTCASDRLGWVCERGAMARWDVAPRFE